VGIMILKPGVAGVAASGRLFFRGPLEWVVNGEAFATPAVFKAAISGAAMSAERPLAETANVAEVEWCLAHAWQRIGQKGISQIPSKINKIGGEWS